MVSPGISRRRILGSMVMRNEADRYLRQVLQHMSSFLNAIFVWDDQSTDNSIEIAEQTLSDSLIDEYAVVRRPDSVPSFLEHEAEYRFGAWQALEQHLRPEVGDWILSFDADEFLVGLSPDFSDVYDLLHQACNLAEEREEVGVIIPFPEIFGVQDGVLQKRVDGFWDTIKGPRLFKYLPGAKWSDKAMGSGSEPTYVANGRSSRDNMNLHMLHFGYANREDHVVKWKRYSELYDHGHSNEHIQSIITKPTLKPWVGPIPRWSSDV